MLDAVTVVDDDVTIVLLHLFIILAQAFFSYSNQKVNK